MSTGNYSIQTFICGQDNLVYLLTDRKKQAVVFDPGMAEPILSILEKQKLKLTHIFLTHHHADHISGIETLKSRYRCRVIGPDLQRIAGLDEIAKDNDILHLPEFSIRTLFTPGHTRTSVCYALEITDGKPAAVFTGDTMFICGCGRCLEGSAQQMHKSLMKLAALPQDTRIYPGHDYTLENYQFALTVESDNETLQKCLLNIQEKGGLSAIPSTVGLEKQTNPFLRTQSLSIRKTLKMPDAPDWEVLARLREMKNAF